jgi:hypothetical protein
MKTSPRLRRPPIPSCRRSKSTSAPIRNCCRQARELIALRSEVATLRAAIAALRPSAAPIATEKAAERAAAKEKLFAEIDAAKAKHVEFVAREAIDKPEQDRKQAEYEAQIRGERLAHSREVKRKWYAANPERVREQKRISEKKWWDVLTPEEKEAHLEKRRAGSRINSKKRRAANPEKARKRSMPGGQQTVKGPMRRAGLGQRRTPRKSRPRMHVAAKRARLRGWRSKSTPA